MNKAILLLAIGVMLSGCGTIGSRYENTNTPYGNNVVATGRAAAFAASANTSHNCPSCAVSGQSWSGGSYAGRPDDGPWFDPSVYVYRLADGVATSATNEVLFVTQQAIRGNR